MWRPRCGQPRWGNRADQQEEPFGEIVAAGWGRRRREQADSFNALKSRTFARHFHEAGLAADPVMTQCSHLLVPIQKISSRPQISSNVSLHSLIDDG